jgi:hypothetical protein
MLFSFGHSHLAVVTFITVDFAEDLPFVALSDPFDEVIEKLEGYDALLMGTSENTYRDNSFQLAHHAFRITFRDHRPPSIDMRWFRRW